MKIYLALMTLATLSTLPAFAQQGEGRDYGDLLGERNFKITHDKTSILDESNIKNFQIVSTPKREEYTYKIDDVKTPRKGLLAPKRSEFKLEVLRDEGKITRFSSVEYDSDKKNGVETLQSTSVLPSGSVNSHTNCQEEYKRGPFGFKSKKSGLKCVTVSAAVCEYLRKTEIGEDLVKKISSCSDTIAKLASHQKELKKLSHDDHKKDMAVIQKLAGSLSNVRNFYEVEPKTMSGVSEIVSGFGSVISQCDYMNEENYFAPKFEPTEENQEPISRSKEE